MKFDLHLHTHRSYDSFSSLDRIMAAAHRRGLTGVAVTDHDVGPITTNVVDMHKGIWVIGGTEIRSDAGDILGLFITKPIVSRSALDVVREIHDQGGIAVLPHLFKYSPRYPDALFDSLDGLETVNGRWQPLSVLPRQAELTSMLQRVRGRTGGSDAHFPQEVGTAGVETPDVSTADELRAALASGLGRPFGRGGAEWLDWPSQMIKLLKQPSARQLARTVVWPVRTHLRNRRAKESRGSAA